jgi:hypothetical protein
MRQATVKRASALCPSDAQILKKARGGKGAM